MTETSRFHSVNWTDETVQQVIALQRNGLSASQIALKLQDKFPGVTRNAVLGKLHRLGLSGGGNPARVRRVDDHGNPILRVPKQYTEPRKWTKRIEGFDHKPAKMAKRKLLVMQPPAANPFIGITITELTDKTCHWIVGEPCDLIYCGAVTTVGKYCPQHTALAYEGPGYQQAKANELAWAEVPAIAIAAE